MSNSNSGVVELVVSHFRITWRMPDEGKSHVVDDVYCEDHQLKRELDKLIAVFVARGCVWTSGKPYAKIEVCRQNIWSVLDIEY